MPLLPIFLQQSALRWIKECSFFTLLKWPGLCCLLGLSSILLAACTGLGSDTGNGQAGKGTVTIATPALVTLSQLRWCEKPDMVFRDAAATIVTPGTTPVATLGPANGTPVTISSWQVVKANLGFTLFLPATLPGNACLMSVASTVRQPVLGSNFLITYIVGNHDSITFSQAPANGKTLTFQCNVATDINTASAAGKNGTATAGQDPVQLCNGTRDKTNIVFSARGKTSVLAQLFQNLQPDVDWMPAT